MIIIFTGVMTMTSEAIWGEAEKQRKERIQRNKERRKSEDGTELEKNVSEERIKEKYEIQ